MAVFAYRTGYSCHTCTPTLRKFRGHEEDGTQGVQRIFGYTITKCPLMFVTEFDKKVLQIWADYKKGILPNNGGGLHQPMKFYALMNIIEGVMSRMDEEENRERSKS